MTEDDHPEEGSEEEPGGEAEPEAVAAPAPAPAPAPATAKAAKEAAAAEEAGHKPAMPVNKPEPDPARASDPKLEREVVVPEPEPEPEGRTLGLWHQLTALRRATPSWIGYFLGAGSVVCVFFVWWWATAGEAEFRVLSPSVGVPSPGEAFAQLGPLYDRGLIEAIVASFRRVVFGFGLAMFVGIGLGIFAASFRPLQAFFRPMVMFGRSIPLAALIPLTGAIFKYGEMSKIMFIFIATVPFVFSDTVASVLTIPERYVDTARTLGASRFQIIRKVLVPLALPEIVTGMRFLFGLAFGYIMLAESIIIEKGLGALIQQSFSRGGEETHVFLLVIIIALLAYTIDRLLLFFQRGLFPYRQDL